MWADVNGDKLIEQCAAGMGDLRDRLRQVVAGFSQVAGSVCRGALVQVRK